MSDRWAVALVAAALIGALRPSSLPLLVAGLLVLTAFVMRQPLLLCLGTLAFVSALAGRSLAGLDELVVGPVVAEVTLVSDPAPTFGGVRADARLAGRRLELRADGVSADALRHRLAGERVSVRGEVEPTPPGSAWLLARHVAGRLRVYAVDSWRPGGLPSRAANALRRTLTDGAEPLTAAHRSLFTGLVIGDDRAQSAGMADDFLGAGLTHLLAVSGQNVAFVLTLAGPLLRRLRLWTRLGVTLAVVGMFGLMTRFEPSVIRAAGMAALATALITIGGSVSRLRILALAVTGLLIVDPLLVRSVGFQLSTAATAAIILLVPRLVAALPGPLILREAMAVTLAAQIGVAPVLLVTFGPLPVASLPANLLAVPAAGPLMVWGLTGGVLAGVAGGWTAELLHLPTRPLLMWVVEVAQRTSALPLGQLRAVHVIALSVGLILMVRARSAGRLGRRVRVRRVGLAVAVASVVVAVVSAQAPPPLRSELLLGVVRWHAGSSEVIVLGAVGGRSQLSARATLAALRVAGVRSVDLLVVADEFVPPGVVAALEGRHRVGTILLAGAADPVVAVAPVAVVPRPGTVVAVGALEVRITATPDRLVVDARPRARNGAAWWPG